jgi:hypothetical protein
VDVVTFRSSGEFVITVFLKRQTLNKYALMMSRGDTATVQNSANSDTGIFVCSDNKGTDV